MDYEGLQRDYVHPRGLFLLCVIRNWGGECAIPTKLQFYCGYWLCGIPTICSYSCRWRCTGHLWQFPNLVFSNNSMAFPRLSTPFTKFHKFSTTFHNSTVVRFVESALIGSLPRPADLVLDRDRLILVDSTVFYTFPQGDLLFAFGIFCSVHFCYSTSSQATLSKVIKILCSTFDFSLGSSSGFKGKILYNIINSPGYLVGPLITAVLLELRNCRPTGLSIL